MNQFYTREEPISKINHGLKIKSGPSDMVLQNLLNYSRSIDVLKSHKRKRFETIQVILN